MSSAVIKSDKNEASVSVISRRLTNIGLRDRIVNKKPYFNLQQRKKDFSGQRKILSGQMINGRKLYDIMKLKYHYLVMMGENM